MLSVSLVSACVAAIALDALVGEPRRAHPIVAFGRLAGFVESAFNRADEHTPGSIVAGALALWILIVPVVLWMLVLTFVLPSFFPGMYAEIMLWCVQVLGLWLALALRSLAEHGVAVADALADFEKHAEPSGRVEKTGLAFAHEKVARIVSRDATLLDKEGIATAATESMLENGADAVFASLFWFVLAGLPGVALHRAVNTLDAMWGYRTPRYERFGKAAARLDDVLNWLPARLTAWTFLLLAMFPCGNAREGDSRTRWQRCHGWRCQVGDWESPNAGPVIAAGASALAVELGGTAPYHGGWKVRPVLGLAGNPASAQTIHAAIQLVRTGVVVWLGALILLTLL